MAPYKFPRDGIAKSYLNQFEKRLYSQNGEDGITEKIFELIGTTNKKFVEIGYSGNGQCNSAILWRPDLEWRGIMIDADLDNYNGIGHNFKDFPGPTFMHEFVTAENVNDLISFEGPIDLFSLDVDGNDFWVWKNLSKIDPRFVIIEYLEVWGPERSIAVPYDPKFMRNTKKSPCKPGEWGHYYYGTSLVAFCKLAKSKGYALVCGDSRACNLFFVKKELLNDTLKEIEPKDAYYTFDYAEAEYAKVAHLPFVQITDEMLGLV